MHFLLAFLVIACCGSSYSITLTKINYLPNGQVGGYELIINNTVQPTITSPLPRDSASKIVQQTSSFGNAFTRVDEQVIGENSYLNVHSILKQQKQLPPVPVRRKYPLKNVLMVPSVRYVNGVRENVKLRFVQIGPYAALIVPTKKLRSLPNSVLPVPPEIRESVKTYIEVQEPPTQAPSSQKTKSGYPYAPPTYKNPSTPEPVGALPTPSEFSQQLQKAGNYIYPPAVNDEPKSAPPEIANAMDHNGFVIRVPNTKSRTGYHEFFVPSRSDQLDRDVDDKIIANPFKYSGSTDSGTSQYGEVYNKDNPSFSSFAASGPLGTNNELLTRNPLESAAHFKYPGAEQAKPSTVSSEPAAVEADKRVDMEGDSHEKHFQTGASSVGSQASEIGYRALEGPPPGQPEFSDVSPESDSQYSSNPQPSLEFNARFPHLGESSRSYLSQLSAANQTVYSPPDTELKGVHTIDASASIHTSQFRYPAYRAKNIKATVSPQPFHGSSVGSDNQVLNGESQFNDFIGEIHQTQDEKPLPLSSENLAQAAVDSTPSIRFQDTSAPATTLSRDNTFSSNNRASAEPNPGKSAVSASAPSAGSEQQLDLCPTQNDRTCLGDNAATANGNPVPHSQIFRGGQNLKLIPQDHLDSASVVPTQHSKQFLSQEEGQFYNAGNSNIVLASSGSSENHPLLSNEKFQAFIQNPSLTTQLEFTSPNGDTSAVLTSTGDSAKVELPLTGSQVGQFKGSIVIPNTVVPLPTQVGYKGSGRLLIPDYNQRSTAVPAVTNQYNSFGYSKNFPSGAELAPASSINQQTSNVFGRAPYDLGPVPKFDSNANGAAATAPDNKQFNQFIATDGENGARPYSSVDFKIGAIAGSDGISENDQQLQRTSFGKSPGIPSTSSQFQQHSEGTSGHGAVAVENLFPQFLKDASSVRKGSEHELGNSQVVLTLAPGTQQDGTLVSTPEYQIVNMNVPEFLRKIQPFEENVLPKYNIPINEHPAAIDIQHSNDALGSKVGGFDPISAAAVAAAAVAADNSHFSRFDPVIIPGTTQASTDLNDQQPEAITTNNEETGPYEAVSDPDDRVVIGGRIPEDTGKSQQLGDTVPKYVIPVPTNARLPIDPQTGGSVEFHDRSGSTYGRAPAQRKGQFPGFRIVASQPASTVGPHTEGLLETLNGLVKVPKRP